LAAIICWLSAILTGIATFLIGRKIALASCLTHHCQVVGSVFALVVGIYVYRLAAGWNMTKKLRSEYRGGEPSPGAPEPRPKAGHSLLVLTTWLGLICFLASILLNGGFLPLFPYRIAESPGVWVLVFGPMTVLPAALLEWCKPRWGAALFMVASVLAGEFAIQGRDEWLACFGLITLTAPMMTLGILLLLTAKRQFSLRTLMACMTIVAISSGFLALRYQNAIP
jgi:hypothetical protein